MAKESKKEKLLKVLKQVLHEYEEGIHLMQTDTCALCKEYMDYSVLDADTCNNCLMLVFHPSQFSYPCMRRKCTPLNSKSFIKNGVETKRVILFYKRIIERIENMSSSAVRRSKFTFMLKIDEEVYNEVS